MNDYQKRRIEEFNDWRAELLTIAAELPGSWQVEDRDPGEDFAPLYLRITREDGFCIAANNDVRSGRIEFSLGAWPTYEDVAGHKQTVTPRDLRPNPGSPGTSVAKGRDPAAVARQIERTVINPGADIIRDLEKLAADRGDHAQRTREAQDSIAECIGETIHRRSDQVSMYARNIAGETLRVEFRSIRSVRLDVTAEEAIALLNALRELRREAEQ